MATDVSLTPSADCCDRTNLGQWIISKVALEQYLQSQGLPPLKGTQLERSHRFLFSEVRPGGIFARSAAYRSLYLYRTGMR